MHKPDPIKKAFFDLNHPADFHFFKYLINWMKEEGYVLKIVARDKECLHLLLEDAGLAYTSRGAGKHSVAGKYLHALRVLALLFIQLLRFRPRICLSLSSPYLSVVSRMLRIRSICWDDTDVNPKLLPLIKRSSYLLSPSTYPHKFHENHFHLPALKELAYLHPSRFQYKPSREAVFFRLTRTDSIHHSEASRLDQDRIWEKMLTLGRENKVILSAEMAMDARELQGIRMADPVHIHQDLAGSKVFWGNSATMAAEAAVLGIPAIFVSAEKFAYISELEDYGLLFHYHPDQLKSSLEKLDVLLAGDPPLDPFKIARERLLEEKVDMTAFLIWFIEHVPDSVNTLQKNPDFVRTFIKKS